MLSLMCRDFQVEFWSFSLRNCVCHVKESELMWGSLAWLTCMILVYRSRLYTDLRLISLKFTVISPTICFIWNPTFHAILCVCIWIMHITLCSVGLQWHKMNRKCPEHPSSSLLTTAVEEKQTSHRLLFLFFFGLFTPWYECFCDRLNCRQCCHSCAGIFKWNFDDIFC